MDQSRRDTRTDPSPPAAADARSQGTKPAEDEVLRFDRVTFSFRGRQPSLQGIDFQVARGKFVAVIGPSGCGKSTILNLAAGLLEPSQGAVYFGGSRLTEVNTSAAYVTQDTNLLPWLTVRGNIGLALKLRNTAKDERDARVTDWINLVGLAGFENHFPRQLSGGMQKRASIARSLIYDPSIVLMDEPFGPLDAITRLKLQQELLNIWESERGTVVFVTHDLTEAICLADEVIVISKGPGTIRGILPVPIKRPRDIVSVMESRDFSEIYRELWEMFKFELG